MILDVRLLLSWVELDQIQHQGNEKQTSPFDHLPYLLLLPHFLSFVSFCFVLFVCLSIHLFVCSVSQSVSFSVSC